MTPDGTEQQGNYVQFQSSYDNMGQGIGQSRPQCYLLEEVQTYSRVGDECSAGHLQSGRYTLTTKVQAATKGTGCHEGFVAFRKKPSQISIRKLD